MVIESNVAINLQIFNKIAQTLGIECAIVLILNDNLNAK